MKKAKSEVGKRECLQLTEGPTETNREAGLESWTRTLRQVTGHQKLRNPTKQCVKARIYSGSKKGAQYS